LLDAFRKGRDTQRVRALANRAQHIARLLRAACEGHQLRIDLEKGNRQPGQQAVGRMLAAESGEGQSAAVAQGLCQCFGNLIRLLDDLTLVDC
jgi:hypothetical protein